MTHEETRPCSRGGLSGGDATNVYDEDTRNAAGISSTDKANSTPYDGPSPLAEWAEEYRLAGWPVVPLCNWELRKPWRYRDKKNPLTGFTGGPGTDADDAQVREWISEGTYFNFAIRMPDVSPCGAVIALDVDARDGGLEHLAAMVRLFGPPGAENGAVCTDASTYVQTARDDGSGHVFFRVLDPPERWRDPGGLSSTQSGVQVVTRWWRYCVASPSVHPQLKTRYAWYVQQAGAWDQERPTDMSELTPLAGPPHVEAIPVLYNRYWIDWLDRDLEAAGVIRRAQESRQADAETRRWAAAVEETRTEDACEAAMAKLEEASREGIRLYFAHEEERRAEKERAVSPVTLDGTAVNGLLGEWATDGEPCSHVRRDVARMLDSTDPRHVRMRTAQLRLVRLGEAGHPGTAVALDAVEAWFCGEVGTQRCGRDWQRTLVRAVEIVAADPTQSTSICWEAAA